MILLHRSLIVVLLLLIIAGVSVWSALTPPSPLSATAEDFLLEGVTIIQPGESRL